MSTAGQIETMEVGVVSATGTEGRNNRNPGREKEEYKDYSSRTESSLLSLFR